jgi:ABC-type multidrug transport system fused ATPase/permease subunit
MPGTLATAALLGVLGTAPLAVIPLVIGYAVDAAVRPGAAPGLGHWIALIAALGLLQAVGAGVTEYVSARAWTLAAVRTQRAVLVHAAGVGAELPRLVRTGEVIAVGTSDADQIGNLYEVVGRAAGSLVAAAVAAVVALRISPTLGAVVVVGVPLATTGLAPLLGPLRRRTEIHREQVSALTSMAADIVSGLRVLRGIGGERRFADRFAGTSRRVRRAGVAAGRVDAGLAGVAVLIPGLVTVLITWLGARSALAGEITAGQLVAFYGVSAFLVVPVGVAGEAAHVVSEALVAAGRAAAVLRLRPSLRGPDHPRPLPPGSFGLAQGELRCPPGRLTVIVPSGPSGELADLLCRFADPADPLDPPVVAIGADGLAPPAVAVGADVRLDAADLGDLRRRVVLAHSQDVLFSGPLAEGLAPGHDAHSDPGFEPPDLATVLWAADATDVVDGLPGGTAEVLVEQGRQLSGGQRQRLLLARALGTGADVLVLDEPTSAVDAHTEARVVERVARLRRGRTTVVITHSPLWAAMADHVEAPGRTAAAERPTPTPAPAPAPAPAHRSETAR